MKTTNQNSHTHTHRGKKQKTCMAGAPQQLSRITVGRKGPKATTVLKRVFSDSNSPLIHFNHNSRFHTHKKE